MNALAIVDSLNKIGIVFFILTLAALVYEIRLFKRDQSNKSKPIIPDFKESKVNAHYTPIQIQQNTQENIKKPSMLPIILTGAFLIIFGIVSVYGLSRVNSQKQTTQDSPSVVPAQNKQTLKSQGVSIYSQNWAEIDNKRVATLSAGSKIYIGVHTVANTGVDQARIRVNQKQWTPEHITQDFNKEKQIFYVPYTIIGNEKELQIEAELHNKDGWPN